MDGYDQGFDVAQLDVYLLILFYLCYSCFQLVQDLFGGHAGDNADNAPESTGQEVSTSVRQLIYCLSLLPSARVGAL